MTVAQLHDYGIMWGNEYDHLLWVQCTTSAESKLFKQPCLRSKADMGIITGVSSILTFVGGMKIRTSSPSPEIRFFLGLRADEWW